jgi:hypothetical protein
MPQKASKHTGILPDAHQVWAKDWISEAVTSISLAKALTTKCSLLAASLLAKLPT